VITRKQLLFSRDNEKIKSWSRENNCCFLEITRKLSRDHEITRKKKYIPWPLRAYKTTCHSRFSEACTYLKM